MIRFNKKPIFINNGYFFKSNRKDANCMWCIGGLSIRQHTIKWCITCIVIPTNATTIESLPQYTGYNGIMPFYLPE